MNIDIQKVIDHIKERGYDEKNRQREYAYNRHYLAYRLYKTGEMSLSELGRIFNRNHATMINCIKQHNNLKKDMIYRRTIEPSVKLLDDVTLQHVPDERDIYSDVLKVGNMEGVRRIKRWINEGIYEQKQEI